VHSYNPLLLQQLVLNRASECVVQRVLRILAANRYCCLLSIQSEIDNVPACSYVTIWCQLSVYHKLRHTRQSFCNVVHLACSRLAECVLTDPEEIRQIVLIAVVKRKLHPNNVVFSKVGVNAPQLALTRTQVLRGEDKFKRYVKLAGYVVVWFVLKHDKVRVIQDVDTGTTIFAVFGKHIESSHAHCDASCKQQRRDEGVQYTPNSI
jgi:hypothetical protein